MATSSAEPAKLFRYSVVGLALNDEIQSEAARLAGSLAHFETTCREPAFRLGLGDLAGLLRSHAGELETLDTWVRRVGMGFLAADSGGFGSAAGVGLPQLSLWRSLGTGLPWFPLTAMFILLVIPSWLRRILLAMLWLELHEPDPEPLRKPEPKPTPEPEPEPSPDDGGTGASRQSEFGLPTRRKLEESPYYGFGTPYASGTYKDKPHPGWDIDGKEGQDIYPIGPGSVALVNTQQDKNGNPVGYGNYVVIEHQLADGRKIYSLYSHLRERPALEVDEPVDRRSVIGAMGQGEGIVHLHLEVRTEEGYDPWRTYADLLEKTWQDYWLNPADVIGNPEYKAIDVQ